jgi:hypothetical protein
MFRPKLEAALAQVFELPVHEHQSGLTNGEANHAVDELYYEINDVVVNVQHERGITFTVEILLEMDFQIGDNAFGYLTQTLSKFDNYPREASVQLTNIQNHEYQIFNTQSRRRVGKEVHFKVTVSHDETHENIKHLTIEE